MKSAKFRVHWLPELDIIVYATGGYHCKGHIHTSIMKRHVGHVTIPRSCGSLSRALTVGLWVWLNAVDDMGVCQQHVDHLTTPLVPDKHSTTVTTTQDKALTKEVGLLDLK